MKKNIAFVGKGLALVLVAIVPYYFLLKDKIEEHDPFYYKATYQSPYLVLGASRAQKGISPNLLEEELQLEHKALNFAFTAVASPYGEPYFDLVKRKLGEISNKGLFILSVHPAGIMDYELARGRREEDFRFYDLYSVNRNPNPEYVLRNITNNRSLLTLLLYRTEQKQKYDVMHYNGWVERTPPDSIRPKRIEDLPAANRLQPIPSPNREKWLQRMVEYLSQHGQVVLVRLPIKKAIREEESKVLPHFESFITELSKTTGVPYLDYGNFADSLTYLDNFHHLDGPGAKTFTRRLAQDIKAQGHW